MQYVYARSYDLISTSEDFNSDFVGALKDMIGNAHVLIQFPWLLHIMKSLPQRLVLKLSPAMGSVFAFEEVCPYPTGICDILTNSIGGLRTSQSYD